MWKSRLSVEATIKNKEVEGQKTLELTASSSRLVQEIARNSKDKKVILTQDQVNAVLNGLEDAIVNLINEGYRGVNVSTLLKLNIVDSEEKEFKNPKTGEPVIRPRGLMTYFKLSTPFRKRIAMNIPFTAGEENRNAIIAVYNKARAKRKEYKATAEAKKIASAKE